MIDFTVSDIGPRLGTRCGTFTDVACRLKTSRRRQARHAERHRRQSGPQKSSLDSGRVVRVGTHALTQTSKATLWGRLRQHRGQLNGRDPGGGDHRASVFRRHVGAALIRRDSLPDDLLASWLDRHRPPDKRASKEADIEHEVSRHIGAMPFLWLSVPERADRVYLESNSLALLSRLTGGPDQPNASWLGRHAERAEIRESGLWNVHHVSGHYEPAFLHRLSRLVDLRA
jgi:hypothetical protein